MLSTCAKQLQSLRYFGFHFTLVPHTYSVSQPLPSHVSLSRNRHRRIAEIDVYTQGLDISLLLCCQHVPNCFNHWGILDSTLHRYPIHILSPTHCHRMCLCQGKGTEESLKSTFLHKGSTFHCFYTVNMCHIVLNNDWHVRQNFNSLVVFFLVRYSQYTQNFNCNVVYIYPKLEL